MTWKKLSIPKLKNLRKRLNRFLYDFGFNVALDEVEKSKKYKRFQTAIKRALFWQIEQVVKPIILERLLQVSKVEKYRVKASYNKELAAILEQVFKDISFDIAFKEIDKNTLRIYFEWGANLGGQAALDRLEIEAIFGVTNPGWLRFLEEAENLLINSVDQTTKEWIAGIIREGLENQLSYLEIADLLRTEAKGMSAVRAEAIARTEIANAMNKTELESYRRMGFAQKRWRTSRDERVCEICAPLDDEVVDSNKNFSIGLDGPPAHVNCRCFPQAVVDERWTIEGQEIWTGG